MSKRRRFEHTPESVTRARHFARQALKGAPAAIVETAELLVSELATNCVRHTGSSFELKIARSSDQIRIEATDRGAGEPVVRSPAPTDPSGRGLQIIELLAADWGVRELRGGGKTVWVRLDSSARAGTSTAVG